MATRNGSKALGHETGQLTPGAKADVILVDLKSQQFTPLMPENDAHLYSHLVFAANGSCVDTTIVDGRILMQGKQFTTIDEQEVLARANEAFQRVVERMVVPTEY
jgi:5-methylthioadenosine/S-adenosylhomocysteine deaminase